MQSILQKNSRDWAFKWTKTGLPGNTKYVAMFSAPHMKTNIIYCIKTLNEVIAKDQESMIPKNIMAQALHSFLSEQVYGKAA